MPEITENQTPMHRTLRKKNRETHNAVERHRKKKINSGINKIGELIPCSPALKQSKNMILDQAYKYISELKRQNDEILLNGGTKEQAEEIVRLRKQLNELQKENDRFAELLKANDICLHDDPTIHWKRKFKSTKVTMVISSNQMQDDILVYTNGNQLNGNCQQAAVQSSPEQALTSVNNSTPETCLDIMEPMAMPDICPLTNGARLPTLVAQQEVPECLPTTRPCLNTVQCNTTSSSSTVPSVLNVSSNSSGQEVLQSALRNCASTTLACCVNTSAQIELEHSTGNFVPNTLETANSHPTQSVLNVTTNTCFALPLHSQQIGMPCAGVENPSGMTPQSFLASSSVSSQRHEMISTKFPVTEYSQKMLASHVCQNAPVSVGGLVVTSPSFKLRTVSNVGMMSCCAMASSWTVCYPACTYTGISDSNSVSTFSRMSSAGNTQTTWTTLQLAGNTVHPVSQGCCSMLPVPVNENPSSRSTFSISESGQLFNNVTIVPSGTTAYEGVSLSSTCKQLKQQVAVTMQPPLQPLPLQSVLAQPQIPVQSAAKMVSLLPPLQVIQMTRPAGTSVSSTPNNPNLIILQPANPTSPAVVRGALNSQAPGQQIVIIQAANQNAVSVVPAQTSNRLPTLDSSQLICSNGNAQNTPNIQTVGGKHLVHILPRPVSSSASTSSQPCTTVGSGQQQTISVNGQLFALQPLKQSGVSSQNTMQIIQPTTSADPNTNVALNTFGALTNLSQSISQMAEQGGLQLSNDQSPSSSAPGKGQVISGNTSASDTMMANTSTDISRASLWHTSSSCSKTSPLGPPSSCKTKKLQKKPLSTKQGAARKTTCTGSKSKVAANCIQNNKFIKDISLNSLTSDDQISSSQGLISQQSSLSQIPTLVVATAAISVPSQEAVDTQQPAASLSQHVHPPHLTEPAVAESFSQEQPDILSEISAASTLVVSLPSSSSRGDLVKNVSCVPSSPCVITDVSTSVPTSSLFSSNAALQASRAFSIDKGSDLVDLQTAVANVCRTSGITGVSAQLESLAAAQQQCSGCDKEKSQDWHKGRLEMSKFATTKEVSNQVSSNMIHGMTHGEKTSSNEKSSLLSFVKDSCADSELCVDSSRETSAGMSFYEKDEPHKDILLVSTEIESGVQQQLCNPDQESMGGSLVSHRQTESPMSTSSGSSRGFSVASMLPDTTREDASCISTMSNTFNNYSLSEPNDIVALAARAIFEHGSPGKNLTSDVTVCDVQAKAQKIPFADKEVCASQQSVKSLSVKENSPNLTEASAAEGQVQQSLPVDTNSKGMPITKTSSSVVKEISNMPLICKSSGSANLSVINHACHSEANQMHVCSSGETLLAEQLPVCAPADLCSEATTYTEQSSQPTLLAEYSHEQLDSVKGNSHSSLVLEPHLKQNNESRKDATKRTGPDDHLISTAKRQKQCQNAAMKLEGKSTVSTVPEQRISECGQTFISQLPTNSSSLLVSSSNPGHADSLSPLFPPTNFPTSNATETLRPTEAHCNVQPRIQEGQGQQLQQHVVSQQTVSSQTGLNVHHGHMYYKHHQGQIRERNLYHLQHQLPHNESSIQPHTHGAQQPRTAQQEIQMQKKRGVMRASQAPQLSIQQKQHPSGSSQGRQKGNHHHHHPHHHHQQQLQQMPHPHFGNSQQDKRCDNSVTNRNHHSSHNQNLHSQDLMHQQQDNARSGPQGSVTPSEQAGQSRIQRLLSSRSLDQQMASKSNAVSRPSEMQFTSHRQERNRISSYSAEALIRKVPSNAESRMGMAVQSPRNNLEQSEMRTYLDLSINKNLPVHSLHTKLSLDHCINSEVQSLPDCPPFKVNVTTQGVGTFEVQSSRGNEMVNSMPAHRGMQSHGFKLGQGTVTERQARLPYLPMQGISSGSGVSLRENEGSCHQSFMQSLLAPPLNEQIGPSQRSVSEHPRNTQCLPPATIEYSCPSAREGVHIRRDGELQNRESCDMTLGAHSSRNSSLSISYSNPSSVADSQGRNTSPNVSAQKNSLRMNESQGSKCHPNSQVSPNVHGAVRPVMSHATVSHGGNEQGHSIQQPNSSGVTQRVRHPAQEGSASKMRQTDRSRSGNHRSGNVFEHGLQLPLASSGSMILGRQQPVGARTGSIVRFMTDGQQLPNDNLTPDQHSLSQNFGFPFIPESSINPPINANPSFIPPVTQPGANRTPALIPVEPQNPLSSFYPPYSPAHPNLSNDLSIPYFSNQIFSSPSTEKANTGGLNNPFGSILSPPRPVGFPQPNFPLLPEIPARPMANTSSITPHLSNFNLTTLFPEIAAAPLAPDSTAMPMSPLLPLTNPALSDVSKQHSNRSAHNISHILGHDGSSAV
ncbi:basic helix-loop-helix domain-containing protein USF3 [Chiloscyllium plagiosum]|uniref:basic helix-loop-helix domain-containing protein USF3 n=1 Tax=Chiloscyllium plagiosum TaxID=36176 RepID=UPI001CB8369D|nr:basic helix-loop-helix domain-containing protein USF3 [Chiloscyllium plagiosum]XP_043547193.1 basic helix-loop-helix domain-containing protein USF3 [Chiloscyllium plagiosum]XP_043547194.1 basic helix-loop-helix domain-containing protein USF3 [Chiloscyllium plagiosum]XP_043547196.1 basic helix-loop-helix domain-containing protein USF3 [Chiloscyllium plagiosum]XP_043547197.1 basic helix-loop-helix domain-containing protein USF3 [Chiloscyllium plagiosum]XP_043547198.1 basic helix-loop-helix do